MKNFWNIAFRNVMSAKRRTLLLGISLFIVSTLFILLNAFSAGVTQRMIENASTLSSGHVNVGGFFKATARGAIPLISEKQKIRSVIEKELPEAKIVERGRGWGRIIGPASSINCGLSGIWYEDETRLFSRLELASEKEYKEGGSEQTLGSFESLKQKDAILIFASQAKKLGVGVGDKLTLIIEAAGGQNNSVDFNVGAIGKDIGLSTNWMVFFSHETLSQLYSLKEDTTGVQMIYLPRVEDAEIAMAKLKEALSTTGFPIMDYDPNPFFFKFNKVMGEDWLGQKLDLTLWKDEISYLLWVTAAIDLISLIIISILGFIIASGIANTMWLSVRERIKEIGTMRAFGTLKRQILGIFLTEALILSLLFVGAAALFSSVLIAILNGIQIPIQSEGIKMFLMTQTLYFAWSPTLLLKTGLVFCLISLLGAVFPALRAARLNPVTALSQGKQ